MLANLEQQQQILHPLLLVPSASWWLLIIGCWEWLPRWPMHSLWQTQKQIETGIASRFRGAGRYPVTHFISGLGLGNNQIK